jgi:hypothetical protein
VAGIFLQRGRRRDPHSLTTKKLYLLIFMVKVGLRKLRLCDYIEVMVAAIRIITSVSDHFQWKTKLGFGLCVENFGGVIVFASEGKLQELASRGDWLPQVGFVLR